MNFKILKSFPTPVGLVARPQDTNIPLYSSDNFMLPYPPEIAPALADA